MYTITLADGTKLENLELNGNNYISDGILADSVFTGKLSSVIITDMETNETETHEDLVLVQNTDYGDGRSWFILAPKSAEQKAKEARESEITDVQLALVEIYGLLTGGM